MVMARQEDGTVMLRAAKHLDAHPDRPFAALRVTRGGYRERPFAALRVTRGGHPIQLHAISAHMPSRPHPMESWTCVLGRCLFSTSSGRPVGITFAPDGSMFISDDKTGVIYHVWYHA
jgi:glucose/arabinose dehydrogenase